MEGDWLLLDESCKLHIKILWCNLRLEVWYSEHLKTPNLFLSHWPERILCRGSQRKLHQHLSFSLCLNVPNCAHGILHSSVCCSGEKRPRLLMMHLCYSHVWVIIFKREETPFWKGKGCLMARRRREKQPWSGSHLPWLQSLQFYYFLQIIRHIFPVWKPTCYSESCSSLAFPKHTLLEKD